MAFDANRSYPSAMSDCESNYHKLASGYAFRGDMNEYSVILLKKNNISQAATLFPNENYNPESRTFQHVRAAEKNGENIS